MKKLISIFVLISIFSCSKEKQQVDTLVVNANVYTVNSMLLIKRKPLPLKTESLLLVGNSKELQKTYEADTIIDAKGQAVVPGFIDAHCHFYRLRF